MYSQPRRLASKDPSVVLPEPVTPIIAMIIVSASLLVSAQQQDHVEKNQDRDYQLQHEHAPLVKLRDHEFIQLAGGLQFFRYQRLVIIHTNFRRADAINASVV